MESTARQTPSGRGIGFAAALILAGGIALSFASAYLAHKELQRDAEGVFLSDARDLARAIENETTAYEEVLTGLSSFMSASRNVTTEEFRHYVEGLQLTKRFPGFQNLNYAEQAGEQHIIRFIEPLERNRQFLGRDIAPLPGPREGLAQARDTGKALTSGRLIRPRGEAHIGLAIRRAVYDQKLPIGTVDERRAAYRGTVGAGYRPVDLVRLVLESGRFDYLRFRMHDVGAANEPAISAPPSDERLLLDSAQLGVAPLSGGAHYQTSIRFPVSGRVWQLAVSAPQRADGLATRLLPLLTLVLGISASLLLFALVRSLASSRQRAEALARDITRELRDSEENLSDAQRMAALGNWWLDVEHGRMHWSEEALRLLGRSNEDAPRDFDSLLACIHEDDREQLRTRLAGARLDAKDYDLELRLHGSDGLLRWVHALGQATLDAEGRIAKLRGTFMDITTRKTNERRTDLEVALSRLLSSPRPSSDTLQDVLRTTAGMYGWSAARLWERGDDAGALRLTAGAGDLDPAEVAATEELLAAASAGHAAWGKTLLADKTPLWLGAQAGNTHPLPEALRAAGGCVLLLPVVTNDEVGDVLAFYSAGGNCGDEATLHAMQIVASQLAHYLQRRRAEDNLKHVAMHDPLTGLPNRRHFHQAVSTGIARAERAGHGLGVLFVDLDRFKNINDALGHSAGDQVLKVCAQRFAEALRESDLIAHISGDEFVVLLERCNDSGAAIAVARKLLSAATRPILLDGQELALTASVGIALYPADGADGEALLKHADIALFRAKEQGRNNYQFYSAQMNTHTAERLAMEAKLRHALDRGELTLHYQPKLDIRTRQVTGVEALLRWNNPELGSVSPATFIPLAEETGLIVPIGAWVLLEACKQAKRWQDSGLPGTRVAVNLSARQFRDPMLGHAIGKAFAESGLDPRLLELEITESMVMQEPEKAAALLQDLKSMGLYLSIDDFGTGYSSLAYLKRFPIDSLKIDRSFIKDIPGNSDDLAITQAVVAMAHGLRLRTVAEGVETEEQLEWLKRFGCEEIQGYLFSKPLPAEEAGRFLAANFRKESTGRFGRGKSVTVA
jgi:diguanylate cyclase (GGDEF)-like protein